MLKDKRLTTNMLENFSQQDIAHLLATSGHNQTALWQAAQKTKEAVFGRQVWLRGLVEISNACANDCYYCGIRRSNTKVPRFRMSLAEIGDCLEFIDKVGYGSVVYQSGEVDTQEFRQYLLDVVTITRQKYPDMGITLSCGEFDLAFYQALNRAGAERYLLRIETSSPELYRTIHPAEMSWHRRRQCLVDLKTAGFQVGSGIMVGFPGQTLESLAQDIMFFRDNYFDMYGVGPYVVHEDTPLGAKPGYAQAWQDNKDNIFSLFKNFMALLRLASPLSNIAASTACDVFSPRGRMEVLDMVGNILMPSVTPATYRNRYQLYQGKPNLDDGADTSFEKIAESLRQSGFAPQFRARGDSKRYLSRQVCADCL